jgi:hypothetical protein
MKKLPRAALSKEGKKIDNKQRALAIEIAQHLYNVRTMFDDDMMRRAVDDLKVNVLMEFNNLKIAKERA